jgi:ankyrin repeat protein
MNNENNENNENYNPLDYDYDYTMDEIEIRNENDGTPDNHLSDDEGYTPYDIAYEGDPDALRKLTKEQLSETSGSNRLTVGHAAAKGNAKKTLETFKYLRDKAPCTLCTQEHYGKTPAHIVAERQSEEAFEYLLKVVPNTFVLKELDGWTPAHYAAHVGNLPMIKLLHDSSAYHTLWQDTEYGNTPMRLAALNGNHAVADYIRYMVPNYNRSIHPVWYLMRIMNRQRQADGKDHLRKELWEIVMRWF